MRVVTCSLLSHQLCGEKTHAASILLRHEATHSPVCFRKINLENPVLRQVLERRHEVLCVLTQKIVTTQKCVIAEHVQVEEKCGGMVGIQTKTVQVRASSGPTRGASGLRPQWFLWFQPWGPWSGWCLRSSGLFR